MGAYYFLVNHFCITLSSPACVMTFSGVSNINGIFFFINTCYMPKLSFVDIFPLFVGIFSLLYFLRSMLPVDDFL